MTTWIRGAIGFGPAAAWPFHISAFQGRCRNALGEQVKAARARSAARELSERQLDDIDPRPRSEFRPDRVDRWMHLEWH